MRKILLLLAAAGLGWFVYDQFRVSAYDGPMDDAEVFVSVCESTKRHKFPQTKPYQGPGPHPVAVVELNDSGHADPYYGLRKFDGTAAGPLRANPADVQLVACVRQDSDENRRKRLDLVRQCPFNRPSDTEVPMYRSTWTATVYDTHTRTEVGSVTVNSPARPECPTRILTVSNRVEELYAEPGAAEYAAALAELIDRNVG